MHDNSVNICVAFRDVAGDYYMYAATTLLSVVQNTRAQLDLHVIHDETLTAAAKITLQALATIYNAKISFYEINSSKITQIGISDSYKFGIGSLYRLFIPELIKRDIVIYLDCDITCNIDILELSKHFQSTPGQYLGAVQDACIKDYIFLKKIMSEKGFDCKKYFNSGVLVFDNREINLTFKNFSKTALRSAQELSASKFIDQDTLNIVFSKFNIKWLDEKYNYLMNIPGRLMKDSEHLQDRILHFAGIKPWKVPYLPASLLFIKYHALVLEIQKEMNLRH